MITRIVLENFKPFATRQTARLAPITLIYGPNSAGKSSVIQALLLMKQTLEGTTDGGTGLIPRGDYVDLGSFRAMIHGHTIKGRTLAIGVGFEPWQAVQHRSVAILEANKQEQATEVTLTFGAASSTGQGKLDSSTVRHVEYVLSGDEAFKMGLDSLQPHAPGKVASVFGSWFPLGAERRFRWDSDHSKAQANTWLQKTLMPRLKDLRGRRFVGSPTYRAARNFLAHMHTGDVQVSPAQAESAIGDAKIFGGLLPVGVQPPRDSRRQSEARLAWLALSSGFDWVAESLRSAIASVSYLGPLRTAPQRHYLVSGGPRSSVGVRGENVPQILNHRQAITGQINSWFARLEVPYAISIERIDDEVTGDLLALRLLDSRTNTEVAQPDVGFGIGQLLPVVVEGLLGRGRTICVEQPEIHLHPRLQANVADLLISTALGGQPDVEGISGKPTSQWIVETHSEALMLRIQRRIRDGSLPAEMVSVLYVHPLEEGGSAILQLRLDDDGSFIDDWPAGFFEESYRELMEGR